jgi:WD40 repeat protein
MNNKAICILALTVLTITVVCGLSEAQQILLSDKEFKVDGEVITTQNISDDGSLYLAGYIVFEKINGTYYLLDVWNLKTNQLIRTFYYHSIKIQAAAFSPDGKYILTGDDDGKIFYWELETGNILATFQTPPNELHDSYPSCGLVRHLAFAPDQKHFISVDGRGKMQYWNITSQQPLHTSKSALATGIIDSEFSPYGEKVLLKLYQETYLYSLINYKVISNYGPGTRIDTRNQNVMEIEVGSEPGKRKIVYWDIETLEKTKESNQFDGWGGRYQISKNGKIVIIPAIDHDSFTQIVNVFQDIRIANIESNGKYSFEKLKISNDDKFLYAFEDGKLHRWDISALTAHANQAEQYKN